jgi:Asp-tRNA(Asn)/Glu-tRNA(Gln) amidotransferase A subunit family amidase
MLVMPEPSQMTASEARQALHAGTLTVEALARSCLQRVKARDPQLQAWAFVDEELLLAEARRLDGAQDRGVLHGIPVAIKDVFLTKDQPTQYNSPLYVGFRPAIDAACVKLLRAAGALIFGKTTTVEFGATGRRAATRNPHNLEHTPGGSSSGSAAAIADKHVPLSLCTQTGGSTIRPASFCGIFGMKPSWGLVSNEGAKVFAPSLDTVGWHARSVADLAMLYQVFDPEAGNMPAFTLRGARVGICRSPAWPDAEAATTYALTAASDRLHAAGAAVSDLDLPAHFAGLLPAQNLIMRTEGRASFLCEYRRDRKQLSADLIAQVENAAGHTRAQLLAAYNLAAECRAQFDAIAASFDLILTPSATGEAPMGFTSTGHWTFNAMWTLLHAPCINVPGFVGPGGLPVGLTLTGARFSDHRILAAADAMATLFSTNPEV